MMRDKSVDYRVRMDSVVLPRRGHRSEFPSLLHRVSYDSLKHSIVNGEVEAVFFLVVSHPPSIMPFEGND